MNKLNDIIKLTANALEDKKAEALTILDIHEVSVMADYFIIASGNNVNQVHALCDHVEKELAKQGCQCRQTEGYQNGNWVLMDYGRALLDTINENPIIFEQEYFPEYSEFADEPFSVTYDEEKQEYVVEGPRIEKMLGYTNLDSEKGFAFFQKFLKQTGILKELEELGIEEGNTVRMYGLSFDYYK